MVEIVTGKKGKLVIRKRHGITYNLSCISSASLSMGLPRRMDDVKRRLSIVSKGIGPWTVPKLPP